MEIVESELQFEIDNFYQSAVPFTVTRVTAHYREWCASVLVKDETFIEQGKRELREALARTNE